jgi:hypothetical protein
MTGTASVRAIGELWIQIEGNAAAPDADTSLMTLGYDSEKKQFAGAFVSGMSTHLWVYDGGSLDGDKLTLPAEGPSMTGDGSAGQYHDVVEQVSGDHFTLSSFTKDEKGAWQHFMTMHYRKK